MKITVYVYWWSILTTAPRIGLQFGYGALGICLCWYDATVLYCGPAGCQVTCAVRLFNWYPLTCLRDQVFHSLVISCLIVASPCSVTLPAWTQVCRRMLPFSWWWTATRARSHQPPGRGPLVAHAARGSTTSKTLMLGRCQQYGDPRLLEVADERNGPSGLRNDDDDDVNVITISCLLLVTIGCFTSLSRQVCRSSLKQSGSLLSRRHHFMFPGRSR